MRLVTLAAAARRLQVGDEGLQCLDRAGVMDCEEVEVGGGLGDGERDGIAFGEEDVGLSRGRRRANEGGGEGEEVAESKGEGVFESGEDG